MIKPTWLEKMRPQVDDKEANMISQLPKRMRSCTDPTLEVCNLSRIGFNSFYNKVKGAAFTAALQHSTWGPSS